MPALAATVLDFLSFVPYFKGKGRIALLVLRLWRQRMPLTMRLPNGSRMWISDDDAGQLLLPYCIGKYEKEVVTVFRQCLSHLRAGDCVVDIGANVGFYAVIAAEHLRNMKGGMVYAFEPNPRAFTHLQKNSELNHFTNLVINPQGVADTNGQLTLYLNPHGITFGSLRPFEPYLTEQVKISVVTLDEYVNRHSGVKVGLIKVDIEGGELLALRGARQVITRDLPMIIYEEYGDAYRAFGYTIHDIRTFLCSLGYRLYLIQPGWPQRARLVKVTESSECSDSGYWNMLALPPERPL